MAIYAISDLHLSFSNKDKPMSVFGDKWEGYEEKIKKDWLKKVMPDDFVLIAGDFSWATYLEEAIDDFKFINELPGKNIILKGNHDYWWETVTKMNKFLKENKFENIYFLYNNCIETDEYLICGTRYWAQEEGQPNEKILKREIERAKMSLNSALKIKEQQAEDKEIIMVTHYPPDNMIIEALKNYDIRKWIYAHIHSNYKDSLVEIQGIKTYLTSCDFLGFELLKIK